MIYKSFEEEEALNCQKSQTPDGITTHPMPSLQPAQRWMWYTQIALCCCWLRHGLVWPTFYEIFVLNDSKGWLLAFRGALPIGNAKQQIWGRTWRAWIWAEVFKMLCDAVLICTMYYANSATVSITRYVILAKFLKFLRLVENQPVACAKHIKARSPLQLLILYFIRLSRCLFYVFAIMG